jgi:tetratricopeptide (TPR) repeat protein
MDDGDAQDLLAALCTDLRLLWRQAGGPSLRELASRLRHGKSQVGALLNGNVRRPPEWELVRGLVDSFHEYAAEHGRLDKLSLRTAADYWRPRYAVLEHAFSRPRRPVAPPAEATPVSTDNRPVPPGRVAHRHGWVLPAMLPTAVAGFAGREAALQDLDARLRAEQRSEPAPSVVVIGGGAGVGKTTLAVRWSHQVARQFPDGQLYVNLRGFDGSGSTMSPAEAVRGLLDALDVPAERIPASLDAQIGLYRSLLAGKRVLVVLDNAASVAQVRPLLPGTRGCFTVVTSRTELAGLVAVEGAHMLPLDLFTVEESRLMLAARLGAARIDAEPRAVDEIIDRCGRLPLALAVVAARAVARRGFPLAALADEVREARDRLDAFDGDDDAETDVRAVFSWSHQKLSPDEARLFRLLALHPGPDLGIPAAASVSAMTEHRARPLMAGLVRANLIIENTPGRHSFQDLLRAYAGELADTVETPAERRAAIHRLLDHYLLAAHAGARLLHPHRDPITVADPAPGTAVVPLDGAEQAMDWFSDEYPVLLAVIDLATRNGFDTHAWQLAWALSDFFDRRGLWQAWASSMEAALGAARRLADRPTEAYAHRGLGRACAQMGRLADALTHFQQALVIFATAGDHTGQAHSYLNLAWTLGRQNKHAEALEYAQYALDHYRIAGHRPGQARALNSVGWRHAHLHQYRQALDYCEQALRLLQEMGDHRGEANTWDSLGYTHHHLGNHSQAATCYQHAVEMFRTVGDRYYEADTLRHLGDTQYEAGAWAAADRSRRAALEILDLLGHADAEQLRTQLSHPDREATAVA